MNTEQYTREEDKEPMHHVIRLKRYEQPHEGYFEEFLREFQFRQRAELLKPSLSAMLMERLHSLVSEIRVPAMAYAGAAVLAIIAGTAIIRQEPQATSPRSYAASYSQTPVTIEKMQPVSLRIYTPPIASQHASLQSPPAFLLQARPATHESPLSF